MTQARSIAPRIAGVDTTTARIAGSPVAPGVAASRLPPGYDSTDLRVLEWIAAHRHGRRTRARRSDLAA